VRINESRDDAETVTVRLDGELDLATADMCQAVCRQLMTDAQVIALIVDLTDLSFCAAAGVRALVDIWDAGVRTGVHVTVRNPGPQVAATLWLTGGWGLLCADTPAPRHHSPTSTRKDHIRHLHIVRAVR